MQLNESKAIYEIPGGNYLAAGLTFDSSANQMTNRLTIMRLNSFGNPIWFKNYGNSKFQYLDAQFCPWFYKQGNYLYHAGSVLDSTNKYYGVLIKFDFNGDTVWQKTYRDNATYILPQMVTGSVDGGFLITGSCADTSSNSIFQKGLLIKTDANGNQLWRKTISKPLPNYIIGNGIIQDSITKKIVVVGYNFSPSPTTTIVYDMTLIFDSLGNEKNRVSFMSSYGGFLFNLIQTKDKKIVVFGASNTPKQIGGEYLTTSFAYKFDINNPGNAIWRIENFDKPGQFNLFSAASELPNSDLVFGGCLDTNHALNLTTNNLTRLTHVYNNGSIKWSRYYDYKSNGPNDDNYQCMQSLNRTSDGGFISAIEYLNGTHPNAFFFVKFDSTGCDSSAAHCATLNLVGLRENKSENAGLNVWPNPATDIVEIKLIQPVNTSLQLQITDVTGRQVDEITINDEVKLSVTKYPPGLYFINLMQNRRCIATRKLMVER